jgi:hypothetical protein
MELPIPTPPPLTLIPSPLIIDQQLTTSTQPFIACHLQFGPHPAALTHADAAMLQNMDLSLRKYTA